MQNQTQRVSATGEPGLLDRISEQVSAPPLLDPEILPGTPQFRFGINGGIRELFCGGDIGIDRQRFAGFDFPFSES